MTPLSPPPICVTAVISIMEWVKGTGRYSWAA